jgi:hypothetical protein
MGIVLLLVTCANKLACPDVKLLFLQHLTSILLARSSRIGSDHVTLEYCYVCHSNELEAAGKKEIMME